jgi:mannose-6-phosphate isomerase
VKRLEGTVQDYAWGSTDFIPELLGTEPTGKPQAELWLGGHASSPSTVDGRPLNELIESDPEGTLGAASVDEFGPQLPYLLKVLSAAKPLSLQAHPTRAQAEAGFAADEEAGLAGDAPTRTYKDTWPKPEMLCALVETEVLCGFREPAKTYALFEALGVPSALALVEPLREGGAEQLEEVFGAILRTEDASSLIGEVAQAADRIGGDRDEALVLFARTAEELAGPYPDDPGVLAALLMNRVSLERNQAIFLGAGNLHAYLHGSAVEIMANSDNVLRGGLTSKHINVEELLKILDFTPGFSGFVDCLEHPDGVFAYRPSAPEFALWRLEPSGRTVPVPSVKSGRVLLVYEGSVVLSSSVEQLELGRGQSAFVPAGEDASLSGDGVVFVAGPGIG